MNKSNTNSSVRVDDFLRGQTVDTVSADYENILRLAKEGKSIDQLKNELKVMFRGYVLSVPVIPAGSIFVRARKSVINSPWKKLSEQSYPNKNIVKQHGRANRKGTSLFYCSNSWLVPFFESQLRSGDAIDVTFWQSKARCLINAAGYCPKTFNDLGSTRQVDVRTSTGLNQQQQELVNKKNEYLARIFTKKDIKIPEIDYRLSVAVAEKMLSEIILTENVEQTDSLLRLKGHDQKRPFDGLMYPSIAMKANGDNFALTPRYAAEHLCFLRADHFEVLAVDSDKMQITWKVLQHADHVDRGVLKWDLTPGYRPWTANSLDGPVLFMLNDTGFYRVGLSGKITFHETNAIKLG